MVKQNCKVKGCTHPLKYPASGLCGMHYQRQRTYGKLFGSKPMRGALGSGHTRVDGYRALQLSNGKRKYEHVLVAEKALGHSLPKGARVHHVNEDRSDNRPENLVICPSVKYHSLLHMRMAALDAGHPANYRFCGLCRKFDDPKNMYVTPNENRAKHRECMRAYARKP